MLLQRTVAAIGRRHVARSTVRRTLSTSIARRAAGSGNVDPSKAVQSSDTRLKKLEEIRTEADLLPPGAPPGTVPTDLEQATGLERLEILGKMEGIDVFDMKPLDASRKGTLDDPIMVKSFGDEQYAGCTGYPADSHHTVWLALSRDRPLERCPECGNCLRMEYVGPDVPQDPNANGRRNYDEPKTFADYVRPEYQ
ncbi:MAG: hypothetical protein M1823_005490 [Watsoniomyces obsoletus]|nr:MAG: hypothetical protein M1823_005490 [Watsoniomyces obsoletus]